MILTGIPWGLGDEKRFGAVRIFRHWCTGGCVRGILRRCEGERFRAAEEVFGGCMVEELQERWGNRFNSERMPTAFLRDAWWLD